MHRGGDESLTDVQWKRRRWSGSQAYSDTKLHDVLLAFAIARRWPDVVSNALEPGWVPTRMGGAGAPDDLSLAHVTQAWLATSEDREAIRSGGYYYHQQARAVNPAANRIELQEQLLAICREASGVALD